MENHLFKQKIKKTNDIPKLDVKNFEKQITRFELRKLNLMDSHTYHEYIKRRIEYDYEGSNFNE